jgi:hypothetical protein
MTSLSINDEQPAGARPAPIDPHAVECTIYPKGETVAELAESALRQVNAKLGEFVANVATRQHLLSTEGVQVELAAFADTAAARAIDVHAAQVDDRAAQAEAKVQAVLDGLVRPGDAAQETRNTRTWDRALRQLDAAAANGEVNQVAHHLLATAPPDQLGLMISELRPYLHSRNIGDEWIDSALEQRVPPLAQARAEARKAEQTRQIISYGAARVREGIANGRPVTVIPSAAEYDPDRM